MIRCLYNDVLHLVISFLLPKEYVTREGFEMDLYLHFVRESGSSNSNPRVIQDVLRYCSLLHNHSSLSYNPSEQAVSYLLAHKRKIDWYWFNQNQNQRAVASLVQYPFRIQRSFSENAHPHAVAFLLENLSYVDWMYFSANTNERAVAYLLAHPDLIEWRRWSGNTHPDAVAYTLAHTECIDWLHFSSNTHDDAVRYALANPTCVNWCMFSENNNPMAVHHLIHHPELIDWHGFSRNDNETALTYLLTRPEDIMWYWLMENKILFKEQPNHRIASFLCQDKCNENLLDVYLTLHDSTLPQSFQIPPKRNRRYRK